MRYLILVLVNLPVILLALLNFITRYKMGKMSKLRFKRQIGLWSLILVVLIASYPVYNQINGRPALVSSELSFFDIIQTTTIIMLLYIVNNQRQKLEANERNSRDLHQEVSIILSEKRK